MPIYTCYNSWHRFTFTIYSFIEIIINLKFVETSLPGYPLTIYTILKLVLQLRSFCSWAKLGGTKFSNFGFEEGDRNNFFFFSIRREKIRRNCQERSLSLSPLFTPKTWARHDVGRTWHGCWELFTTRAEGGGQWSRRTLETLGRFIGLKGNLSPRRVPPRHRSTVSPINFL